MNSTLSSYLLSSAFMLIVLGILAVRSYSAVIDKDRRHSSQYLIGGTALYVMIDAVFIVCHLSGNLELIEWKVVSFLFYIVYTGLPFVWHLFVRNFVGSTFKKIFFKIELIPIIILLGMVLITPFTGALYYFDAAGRYTRGPAYSFYSMLNYFYYLESVLDLLIINMQKGEKKEPYAFRTMLISLIMVIGAFINGSVIPSGTIFPFMPFCSVIVTMLAFYFIATKDSELIKEHKDEELREALEQAREASQAKTDFLSRMSHDIRTPMNGIINLTELALKEPVSDTVHGYLDKALTSGKFLMGLINDILDMSRIESGNLVLNKENLNRREFLSMVDTVIEPLADEKHIKFHCELNPGEYTISVDKLRFNQIFFNLLSNAVKFTPAGGDIWFNVSNQEVENGKLTIKFVVKDSGIGMSQEFQNHLFEPFSQEHSKLSDSTKGTGLGLSIVKKLVEAMDGTISVKSELGKGSEFIVTLRVDVVAKGEIAPPVKEQTQQQSLEGMQILLVEDNEINTYLAKVILEGYGCVVHTAVNGQEAVDAFTASQSHFFNAILMDVRMPIMDGLEATRRIRALTDRPDSATVPIIAMTADAFDEERKRTLESGMNYHLAKPFDAQKLYEILCKCVH